MRESKDILIDNFIQSPNLPRGRVRLMLMSGEYPELCEKFENLGVEIIRTGPDLRLPYPERFHVDIQCQHLGGRSIMLVSGNIILKNKLLTLGFNVYETFNMIKEIYPGNVLLNSVRLNKRVILNKKTVDNNLLDFYKNTNVELINVRQGYTRCSTAIINDHSIITSDPSIYKEAKKIGLDVLKIRPGFINLPGYNYGFIGGACTLIDKNIIVFTGDINTHPDCELIYNFISERNIEIINLTSGTLIDIGGMIQLKEYI